MHVHAEYFKVKNSENSVAALVLPKHLMIVHKDKGRALTLLLCFTAAVSAETNSDKPTIHYLLNNKQQTFSS